MMIWNHFSRFGLVLEIYIAWKVYDMASKELPHITEEPSLEIHKSRNEKMTN